ncbi:MAG TPA: hypothetical protein VJY65_00505 [Chloroflexota bacterium]|nr:hypothetical protein [Chloroflexota bacterium]
MGKVRFPLPADIGEIVALLNASQLWNATLSSEDGALVLYDGDQPMFEAATAHQMKDFLAGCFLMTFNGADLDQIRHDIASGQGKFGQSTPEWRHEME